MMTDNEPALIDRRGHLAQLMVQALLAGAAFVADSWIPLALAAGLFTVAAIAWPRGAPVLRAWEAVSRVRGQRWLDDGRPARISTALAAANFSALAVTVGLGGETPLVWAVVVFLCAALTAEVVVGACIPCELVVWASRRGLLRFQLPIGTTR